MKTFKEIVAYVIDHGEKQFSYFEEYPLINFYYNLQKDKSYIRINASLLNETNAVSVSMSFMNNEEGNFFYADFDNKNEIQSIVKEINNSELIP